MAFMLSTFMAFQKNSKKNESSPWSLCTARLLDAALSGSRQQVELAALTALRTIKPHDPQGAQALADILHKHQGGAMATRGMPIPPPVDAESTFSLLQIEHMANDTSKPVLSETTTALVERFIRERKSAARLIAEGFMPPSSLLLCGEPGTGKTMLARWMAKELGLKMATLDLSTSISSYLGRTGANLRRILDYARATPTLLLLDEFDSIAKRRDDTSDVGELKRIVNVLLKELENWPSTSVLVAATNHTGLIDPAAFRRFERVVEIPLPAIEERIKILENSLGQFAKTLGNPFIHSLATLSVGMNGSNLDQIAKTIARRHLVDDVDLESVLIAEAKTITLKLHLQERTQILQELHTQLGSEMPLRVFSELFGLSISTIHHHLNKSDSKKEIKKKKSLSK